MTGKEWVRIVGKDGVYLIEGEDYTVDREEGTITITERGWAKCPTDIRVPYRIGEER